MKRVILIAGMFAVLLFALAPQAPAEVVTLTDLNSTVNVNTTNGSGMYTWYVDGVDQMYQQWFWYRIGSTGGEQAINTIGAPTVNQFASNGATMTYRNDVLSVAVTYLLTGGTAGSHTSDVAETIRIVNTGRSAIDLHFFQYSDFDLNGTNAGQTVTMLNDNTVRQSGAGMVMSETVVFPTATHHEANLYGSIVSSLSDDSPTTLSGANGPVSGDATWAFQWDRTIAAGGTFLISKDKNLSAAVPEPASIILLGGCLLLVARKFRRV